MMTHRNTAFPLRQLSLALTVLATLGMQGCSSVPPQQAMGPATIDNNFGLPVGFSTQKMDLTADPRVDFARYAGGGFLAAAQIPGDLPRISSFDVLARRTDRQLQALIEQASQVSAQASKGSVLQQVGDFYASGMNEAQLRKNGNAPLQPYFQRINQATAGADFARMLAEFTITLNDSFMFATQVAGDTADRQRNAIYFADGGLLLSSDNYLKPDNAAIRSAYVNYIRDNLQLAGISATEAQQQAEQILAIERQIAAKKLTPVQKRDPNLRYSKMPYRQLQAELSNFDLDAFFHTLGLPTDQDVIVVELQALRERNAILQQYPQTTIQAYLRWEFLRHTSAFLDPAFDQPRQAFSDALYGPSVAPSRAERIARLLPAQLGHPLSKLYVDRYFPAANQRAVEEITTLIKQEYRQQLVNNDWLSTQTRQNALDKFDQITLKVGYPSHWIDYSSVEIRRDDFFGNVLRINRFQALRNLRQFNQPVTQDEFAMPGQTLPIDINAAYDSSRNGIEIPAAFLQAPLYDAKADPAVNFCGMGAVIGHELTHGFDATGRNYDGGGNVRNWWSTQDVQNFVSRTGKLVQQANRYSAGPGLQINGELAVGENLADAGGLALGYRALQTYLRAHPEQNRSIDGFTQSQRCFLAWGQLWASKAKPEWLKQSLATDPHPPGNYRSYAPAQHLDAFYQAFNIQPGDPMWLNEADRAKVW
ncbi:M13 family metallopeptidase [Chitinibacter tainanensis]|uniref:M13 family metallopeptidase n=1 Tax=Chitinibacter tainanensis TaxID=230667 RepID=UPI00054D5C7A|nr:M13 family metallopeptidase [Chitinibacter tainanensis]